MDAEIKWNLPNFYWMKMELLIAKFDSNVGPMSDEIVKYLK